jgi:hypothetical protein
MAFPLALSLGALAPQCSNRRHDTLEEQFHG